MNTPITVTLVVDNEASGGLQAEHGFAAWIDTGKTTFLFDTGQGPALVHNARALQIDLDQAEFLILSHGHYDHTGAVPDFLVANRHAPVIYGRGATIRRFSCHPGQEPRQIGIAETVLQTLEGLPQERRIVLDTSRHLRPCIGITGPVPRLTVFEDTGGPFFLDAEKSQSECRRSRPPYPLLGKAYAHPHFFAPAKTRKPPQARRDDKDASTPRANIDSGGKNTALRGRTFLAGNPATLSRNSSNVTQ